MLRSDRPSMAENQEFTVSIGPPRTARILVSVSIFTAVVALTGLLADLTVGKDWGDRSTVSESEDVLIAVAPPPFSEDIFPCSDCHDPEDEVDVTRREVDIHDDIVFEHDAENRWCLDCHDTKNRDVLHLADGSPVAFTDSYLLCGQCHGPQLKNWRAGDHGRRTGYWSGRKEYLLCAHCHNPHSPAIKPMEPLPPPPRQELIR